MTPVSASIMSGGIRCGARPDVWVAAARPNDVHPACRNTGKDVPSVFLPQHPVPFATTLHRGHNNVHSSLSYIAASKAENQLKNRNGQAFAPGFPVRTEGAAGRACSVSIRSEPFPERHRVQTTNLQHVVVTKVRRDIGMDGLLPGHNGRTKR